MKISHFSLRTAIVLLMVALSVTLVLFATYIYQGISLQNQRSELRQTLELEAQRLLRQLDEVTTDVAVHLNSDETFRTAYEARDYPALTDILDNQFDQYVTTAGILDLVQVYVYTSDFELVAQSTRGPSASNVDSVLCRQQLALARQRQGVDRYKTVGSLCAYLHRPFYTAIVPIGGFKLKGYLQVVSDPLHNFSTLEQRMGSAVKLFFDNGELGYRSDDWKAADQGAPAYEASYWLTDRHGRKLLGVSLQKEMARYINQLSSARNTLLLAAALATAIIVLIALLLVERMTLRPLRSLADQARNSLKDRQLLAQPIEVAGRGELQVLAETFNEMKAELAELYQRYDELAHFDPLTRLPNRSLFKDRLEQMILLGERRGERFAVMLLDLDDFKEVNDSLSHDIGDALLKEVAERLSKILRASTTLARVGNEAEPYFMLTNGDGSYSTVARLGGDEFAILLPHLNGVEDAIRVASRITQALQSPVVINSHSISVTASLGLALYPDHGKQGELLLRRADIALCVAKLEQRDIAIYDHHYEQQGAQHLELKAELRKAIETGGLSLHYQPKLDCRSGRIGAVEALVRWRHPVLGEVDPAQVIQLSEYKGFIGSLTEWSIDHALAQNRAWRELGVELQVAINISSRVLYDLSLPEKIEGALKRYELQPEAICIELREEATMVDQKQVLQTLVRLNGMGIRLSIDDFGSGFSSLSFLKTLPVDEIKIDRSFISEMVTSGDDANIVRAAADLAHNLGLEVVAEGVEDGQTLEMVKRIGCDFAQGYYVGGPLAADELLSWVKSHSGD